MPRYTIPKTRYKSIFDQPEHNKNDVGPASYFSTSSLITPSKNLDPNASRFSDNQSFGLDVNPYEI